MRTLNRTTFTRLLLERPEVAFPRTDTKVAAVFTNDFDLDLAPGAVGLLVRGVVAERVLRADLRDNFVVDAVELLDRRREERLPAGDLGDLRELHPLVVPDRLRLV